MMPFTMRRRNTNGKAHSEVAHHTLMHPSDACFSSISWSKELKATSGLRFRAKHFDLFAAARSIRQRHRDEDAIAIPYKSLRFDDGLGVSRRRDIDVGDFLVLQRLRDKLGRVGAEFQFDLPARRVAAGRDPIVFPHYRAYEQNSTDRYTVALGIHIWETG